MAFGYFNEAIVTKIVTTLREVVAGNPAYNDLTVADAYPQFEQQQRGVYIESTSFNPLPLSANNFVGTLISHVFAAKTQQQPLNGAGDGQTPLVTGSFIEWVREDTQWYNQRRRDDVSDQVGAGNDLFYADHGRWVAGLDAERPVRSFDIQVWVDGQRVEPLALDAQAGWFRVPWVVPGQTVEVAYTYRRIPDPAGLHYMQVTSPNTLRKRLLGVVRRQVLVETYAGEGQIALPHQHIVPHSLRVHLPAQTLLVENTHFTLDSLGGVIEFLTPAKIPRTRLTVSYRWAEQVETDHAFVPGQASNRIVPGAVIAFGEQVKIGDLAVIGTLPERTDIAEIYGGRADCQLSLLVYARDPDQRQEIVDWLALQWLGPLKERFDGEGLALTQVAIGGSQQVPYGEGGTEFYYTQTIDLTIQVDWEFHRSFPLRVEGFQTQLEPLAERVVPAPWQGAVLIPLGHFDAGFNLMERYK